MTAADNLVNEAQRRECDGTNVLKRRMRCDSIVIGVDFCASSTAAIVLTCMAGEAEAD